MHTQMWPSAQSLTNYVAFQRGLIWSALLYGKAVARKGHIYRTDWGYKTLAPIYRTARRHIPVDHIPNVNRHDNPSYQHEM